MNKIVSTDFITDDVQRLVPVDATATTPKNAAVAKLMKAWEAKTTQRTAKGAGLTLMALSLAACNDDNTTAAAPTTPTTPTTPVTPAGQTFTLTTAIDTKTGGAGDDTFIGDNASSSLADQVDGGAGTDTIKLYGNAAKPTLVNVEIVELTGNTLGFDVSADAAVTTLNLIDPTTAQTYTIAAGQKVSVSTVAATEVVDFAGNTVTALDLTVSGFGTAASNATIDLNSTAQTSLTLNSGSATSGVTITNTGGKLATITLTGSTAIDISHALTTVTSINASTTTGGVDIEGVGASSLVFTGGTGNDSITLGATLTSADTIDGGAGTDVIAVSTATTAANAAKVKNFEVLDVSGSASIAHDIDAFATNNTITNVALSAALAGDNLVTISNLASGGTLTLGGATALTATDDATVNIKNAAVAGSNSDVANVAIVGTAAVDFGDLTIDNVETINIASGGASTGNSIALFDGDKVATLVVTGSSELTITSFTGSALLTNIDASGATGAFKMGAAGASTAATLIKGGAGGDVLIGNAGADIITGGAGADTITAGAGADTLTGGAGVDTFNYDISEASIISVANTNKITDFVAGTDKIQFGDDAGDVFTGITATAITIGANVTDSDSVATLADVLTQIGTGTAVSTGTLQGVVYTFTTGAAAGTYLHINDDGTAAADAADILVNLTGISGTLTATDFTFV